MAKPISSREVGYLPDCDGVMRGETDEEVMRAAAEHGRTVHGIGRRAAGRSGDAAHGPRLHP